MILNEIFSKKNKLPQKSRRDVTLRTEIAKLATEYRKIKKSGGSEDAAADVFRKIVAVTGPKRANQIIDGKDESLDDIKKNKLS